MLLLLMGCAADWVLTTNRAGGGAPGASLLLDTKTVGAVTGVPCASRATAMDWSPGGTSFGLALDWDQAAHPLAWVSANNTDALGSCPAGTGSGCIGARWFGSTTITRDDHPGFDGADPKPVDILGHYPDVLVAEKEHHTIEQWDVTTDTLTSVHRLPDASEVTQLDWVDGDRFVATVPKVESSCAPGTNGEIWLSRLDRDAPLHVLEIAPSADVSSKPEGVNVGPAGGTCAVTTDYVAYVGDYCDSRLHVVEIDVDADAMTEAVSVDLAVDGTGSASRLSGACNPATARLRGDAVYMVCQTRNSLLKLDVSDPCAPVWDAGHDEVRLRKSNAGAPSCTATPAMIDCGVGDCGPHGVAFSDRTATDWLYVNLTTEGQVIAVRDDLSEQFALYADNTDYQPLEIEVKSAAPY